MCSRRTSDGLIAYSGMDLVQAGGTFQNYWGPIFTCPDCNCHWSSNVCSNPDCAQHGKRIPGKEMPEIMSLEQVQAMYAKRKPRTPRNAIQPSGTPDSPGTP